MSSEKSEPAFPVDSVAEHQYCGMSLRDYFAAKAMQGFNANHGFNERSHEFIADLAYAQADAMLAARTK